MLLAFSRLILAAAVASWLWATCAPPVQAQSREEEARELFEAGITASRAGRWDDARNAFERSHRLIPKPSTLLNLAIAQLALEQAQEALISLAALQRLADPREHASLLDAASKLRVEAQEALAAQAASRRPS